jgi:hypothetical protein
VWQRVKKNSAPVGVEVERPTQHRYPRVPFLGRGSGVVRGRRYRMVLGVRSPSKHPYGDWLRRDLPLSSDALRDQLWVDEAAPAGGFLGGLLLEALPGDHLIPHPMVWWTCGIACERALSAWPCLAQMGYGRGGAASWTPCVQASPEAGV